MSASDQRIAGILRSVRNIAVLGASNRPERPSHGVLDFLARRGYRVFPVNPALAGSSLLGHEVYASLADIPDAVDMVDVFRDSRYLAGVVEEAIRCEARVLWTQLGVSDADAEARARDSGLEVVVDRCPAIEWPRLTGLGLLP